MELCVPPTHLRWPVQELQDTHKSLVEELRCKAWRDALLSCRGLRQTGAQQVTALDIDNSCRR